MIEFMRFSMQTITSKAILLYSNCFFQKVRENLSFQSRKKG